MNESLDLVASPTPHSKWDEFWYRPAHGRPLHCLSLLTAAVLLVWFASWLGPGARWLAPDGLVSPATVGELASHWIQSRLVGGHPYQWLPFVGIIAAVLWGTGKWTPFPPLVVWLALLAIVHRTPMVAGRLEALLAALCGYLLFAPARLKDDELSTRSRVIRRLIQFHLSALLLATGLQQVGGSEVWWNGEAAWWLVASEPQRIIDLTFLHSHGLILDAATLYGAIYPLAAAALVWSGRHRLVVGLGVPYWIVMGLLTGEWLYFSLLPASVWFAFRPDSAV